MIKDNAEFLHGERRGNLGITHEMESESGALCSAIFLIQNHDWMEDVIAWMEDEKLRLQDIWRDMIKREIQHGRATMDDFDHLVKVIRGEI